jgi:hypothetical protein
MIQMPRERNLTEKPKTTCCGANCSLIARWRFVGFPGLKREGPGAPGARHAAIGLLLEAFILNGTDVASTNCGIGARESSLIHGNQIAV